MIEQEILVLNQTESKEKSLSWIKVAGEEIPYFSTEDGCSWTPIGQNDAVNWPDLNNLFMRKDYNQVENHLIWLKKHGVNVLRLMLEYCQDNYRYLERPAGTFNPKMLRFWDDLFYLCEKHSIRLLLTPLDTFWMRLRWKHHPYNKKNGGPLAVGSEWLISPDAMDALKNRFSFAIERWGGSGALFAWDLWNEIHPVLCRGKTEPVFDFIAELSEHIRTQEMRLFGKSHLQTVSAFGPHLVGNPELSDSIFKHPELDFATSHFYDSATIDNPRNTVNPAITVGRLIREALREIEDNRPFFDSEHGPIYRFKTRKITLPESFDNEYFKHIQWAHMASGGAGGGMRWPNRHPHVLTHGMRRHQLNLQKFCKLIHWKKFRRKNLNEEVQLSQPAFVPFSCGDKNQAVLYLLRTDSIKKKHLDQNAPAQTVKVSIPGLAPGEFCVTEFNTETGLPKKSKTYHHKNSLLQFIMEDLVTDVAVSVHKIK